MRFLLVKSIVTVLALVRYEGTLFSKKVMKISFFFFKINNVLVIVKYSGIHDIFLSFSRVT